MRPGCRIWTARGDCAGRASPRDRRHSRTWGGPRRPKPTANRPAPDTEGHISGEFVGSQTGFAAAPEPSALQLEDSKVGYADAVSRLRAWCGCPSPEIE